MVDVLLKTKLVVPPLRSLLVARPRLFKLLDGGLNRKLILLAAPAGYGKTTLLASWLRQVERPYAWLSLDEEDNDPVRFVQHFTAAIRSLFPSYGQTVLTFLSGENVPPPSQLITLILNDLTEIPTEILLVLDDYHAITNPQLQSAIAKLVAHLPRQLHLVMTTRFDPALPLGRLRVQAQVQEIRARDLRLTTTESASFLSKVMGLELNAEDIHILEARTEGWVAGLQIAALSLRELSNREDQHNFIEAFSGSHRHVMDYLFAEVLDGCPPDTQDFLIHTSIAPRLCADLCNALTDREDGQTMLEQLDADNYFVVPLDYERRWYRYHHLFSNLLRRRMSAVQPEALMALYQRASAWFEAEGDLITAIDLALDGGLYDLAAHLMVTTSEELIWRQGEWETLNRWMQVLPEEITHAYPRLRLDHATYLHLRGQSARARRVVDDVAAHIQTVEPVDPLVPALVETLSAALARMTGDVPGTIRHGRVALDLLPDETTYWHGMTWFNLGAAYYLGDSGDFVQEALEAALTASEETNNMTVSLVTTGFLAQLQTRYGRLHDAERIYRHAIEEDVASGSGAPPLFTSGIAQIGLSSLLREWNDLHSASVAAEKGLSIGRQVKNLITIMAGLLSLAGILQAQGDFETAEPLIKEAEAMLAVPLLSWTWTAVPSAAAVVRLWLRQGRSAAAGRVMGGLEPHLGSDAHLYGYWNEEVALAQARWMLANDDHKTAAKHLESLIESSGDKQRTGTLVQALILQSLAFEGQAQAERALRSLDRALHLAEPSGYVRTFIDEDPTMANLLARMTDNGYAALLLQAMNATLTTLPASTQAITYPALIEALSDRELQILRLMAGRLSNREIADELYLATTTIKWYSRQIYRKLGVHGRRKAAERGRALGLI